MNMVNMMKTTNALQYVPVLQTSQQKIAGPSGASISSYTDIVDEPHWFSQTVEKQSMPNSFWQATMGGQISLLVKQSSNKSNPSTASQKYQFVQDSTPPIITKGKLVSFLT
jgi:hypothetical protein